MFASRLINEAHDALPILGRVSSLEYHQKAAMKLQMQEKEGENEELRRRFARVKKAGDWRLRPALHQWIAQQELPRLAALLATAGGEHEPLGMRMVPGDGNCCFLALAVPAG